MILHLETNIPTTTKEKGKIKRRKLPMPSAPFEQYFLETQTKVEYQLLIGQELSKLQSHGLRK
jgi:hypothetical protein